LCDLLTHSLVDVSILAAASSNEYVRTIPGFLHWPEHPTDGERPQNIIHKSLTDIVEIPSPHTNVGKFAYGISLRRREKDRLGVNVSVKINCCHTKNNYPHFSK